MTQTVQRLVIWGASGHARVIREALGVDAPPLVAVFDREEVRPPFDDVPLFSGVEAWTQWCADAGDLTSTGFVIAIGGSRGDDRCELHSKLSGSGLMPVTVIHDRAFVASGAQCGDGSQVLAMAALCEGASIGRQTILNTGATVDHESVLGDGVHVGPGAHLAGLVKVDDNAFIGTGAVVLPRVHIGAGAVVGAGAVIRHDVPARATMVGNPPRQIASSHE